MSEAATKELASLQKKSTLIDNLCNIPPFNGENSISLGDFVEKWESLSTFFSWDEAEKKFALLNRISGSAANLLKIHKSKTSTELVKILEQRFSHTDTPDIALAKFLNFKQVAGMAVQDFYDRASDLSLKALVIDGISDAIVQKSRDAMLHSMLLGNLAPEIRKGVISKDPKTPDQVLAYALLEEKACRSVNPFYTLESVNNTPNPQFGIACAATFPPTQPTNNRNREIDDLREKLDLLTAKIDSLVVTKTEVNRAQGQELGNSNQFLCHYCGNPNHFIKNCPQNPRNHFWQEDRGNTMDRRGMDRGRTQNRGNYSQRNYRDDDYDERQYDNGNYRNNYRKRGNNQSYRGRNPRKRENFEEETQKTSNKTQSTENTSSPTLNG